MSSPLLTPERARFIRFCAVGASGTVVNLGVFTLFMRYVLVSTLPAEHSRFLASNAAGFLVSVATNFLLNDFWTWGDREKHGHAHFWARLSKFYVVASVAGVVQLGVAFAARQGLHLWNEAAVLCGIAVATLINFVANHHWTFREKRREPAIEAQPAVAPRADTRQ